MLAVGCLMQSGLAILMPAAITMVGSGHVIGPAGEVVTNESALVDEDPLGGDICDIDELGCEVADDGPAVVVVALAIAPVPSRVAKAMRTAARATRCSREGELESIGEATIRAAPNSMVVVSRPTKSIVSHPRRM